MRVRESDSRTRIFLSGKVFLFEAEQASKPVIKRTISSDSLNFLRPPLGSGAGERLSLALF